MQMFPSDVFFRDLLHPAQSASVHHNHNLCILHVELPHTSRILLEIPTDPPERSEEAIRRFAHLSTPFLYCKDGVWSIGPKIISLRNNTSMLGNVVADQWNIGVQIFFICS